MQELSKSQKARRAIFKFKTLVDAVMLRGGFEPSGRTGVTLEEALLQISPEIYGSMGDSRIVELKGLEYVIDRMPRGIEKCSRIILTAQEDFHQTAFEEIIPLKRRRISYAMSEREICFVITRGMSEIYDILTHITFINIESKKIVQQIVKKDGSICCEWNTLEDTVMSNRELVGEELDKAIWNLSIIVGRTYKETKEAYEYLEKGHKEKNSNNGLFAIIYEIGNRKLEELENEDEELSIHFTPSLNDMVGHHKYASLWASSIKETLLELGLHTRKIHIISANLHSIKNIFYLQGWLNNNGHDNGGDIYDQVVQYRGNEKEITKYAEENGLYTHNDESGSNIDVQIIDTQMIPEDSLYKEFDFDYERMQKHKPVIVVMDYAFGTQAYKLMDELLCPQIVKNHEIHLDIQSISIMGKAGILQGDKGDVMLATAHVMEGTANNYIVNNDLKESDFQNEINCYTGPMVTVLGTSLQNTDVLERFHQSDWKAVGLEMEGAHYQRAINGAIIQGSIRKNIKTRYAYYASDNPLKSGQTLASGPMGKDGIVPTYLITKVILQKIIAG